MSTIYYLMGGGGSSVIYTKGATVILTSNHDEIPSDSEIFDSETHSPIITGYVDMLSAAGNDYGKAGKEDQAPPAYESNFSALMSKKKGVRRVKFQDTDDNSADTEATDYSASDVSIIFPHSTSFGAWDENTMIVAEINAVKKRVPRFYETYCTQETVSTLSAILTQIDTAITESDTDSLASLKTSLESALENVAYNYDSKIAQVYVATDKGDGTSYGTDSSTGLKKADGYVSAQMVVVDTDGGIMAGDLSWAGQIKVRGNSTAGGAKRPYNIKFSSKVDLFGFGKSKKWVLLADFFDPTLMRNKTAFDLGEMLGLEATPGHQRVEVWVDGSYRGMYLLTEKIEADENRVNISTKNGDFLLELDYRTDADSVYITTTNIKKRFQLHEPEEPTDEQKTAILETLGNFETAIMSGTWEEVQTVADTESFASFYVLNEIMKTVDFGGLSVFFYCKDGIMYAGPAWDYDLSSGNLGTTYNDAQRSTEGVFVAQYHYYMYLSKFTEFQLLVSEKLQKLYDSGIIEWTFTDIESDTEFYADAIDRNNSTWNPSVRRGGTLQMQPKSTYAENLTFLTNWLSARYDWMTDYFLNRTYISSDTFPDAALLAYAQTLDTDSDSFLSTTEKSAVTSINLSGMNLTSLNLTGLEIFTQLQTLDITDNPSLAQVNIHSFPNLNINYDETTLLIDSVPIFSKHSLVLSGQIGVDFYVTIPEGINTDGAYAEFTVNGITGNPVMLDNAEITEDGEYMFTCYINSVQMADTITAVFHYDSETITNEYSAKRYLDTLLADSTSYSEKLVNLARAVKDLGHYVQEPLAAHNNWVIGEKHQAMDCGNTDIDILSGVDVAALSEFALVKNLENTGIKSLMFTLELESETTIIICLYPEESYTGSVNAYLDGSTENLAVQLQDGSYIITLSGISAHLLGEKYTIHVYAEKVFDVEISALSYAHNVLKSSSDDNLKKAVAALYKYYDSTVKYRAED